MVNFICFVLSDLLLFVYCVLALVDCAVCYRLLCFVFWFMCLLGYYGVDVACGCFLFMGLFVCLRFD